MCVLCAVVSVAAVHNSSLSTYRGAALSATRAFDSLSRNAVAFSISSAKVVSRYEQCSVWQGKA